MPTPEEFLQSLRENEDPDAMLMLQLAEMGSDLRKPHKPEFCFELADNQNLEALGQILCDMDFDVDVYGPDPQNPGYQLIAKREMILQLEVMQELTIKLEALAARFAVSYDGWGAELVE